MADENKTYIIPPNVQPTITTSPGVKLKDTTFYKSCPSCDGNHYVKKVLPSNVLQLDGDKLQLLSYMRHTNRRDHGQRTRDGTKNDRRQHFIMSYHHRSSKSLSPVNKQELCIQSTNQKLYQQRLDCGKQSCGEPLMICSTEEWNTHWSLPKKNQGNGSLITARTLN